MGYTNETAQLMSVPPYVAGCICCITCGIFADKWQQRGVFMIGNCLCAILGFAMLAGVRSEGVKYFACFLIGTCPLACLLVIPSSWNADDTSL